jgi:transcriptional regulator with XRE-family HTH domain
MNFQVIRSLTGKDEYVPFQLEEYITNPIAIARIKAKLTQIELAERLGVSQAYISQLESQVKVTPKTLQKIEQALHHFNV